MELAAVDAAAWDSDCFRMDLFCPLEIKKKLVSTLIREALKFLARRVAKKSGGFTA